MSIALETTTQPICILSLVHVYVSAKHIFSWTPQLLNDFHKHKMTKKNLFEGLE